MGDVLPTEARLYDTDRLAEALTGDANGFLGHLLRLLAKADPGNYRRLAVIFPGETRLYACWMLATGADGGSPTLADVARRYLAQLELRDVDEQPEPALPRQVLLELVEGGD
jgi:hypothetical protein